MTSLFSGRSAISVGLISLVIVAMVIAALSWLPDAITQVLGVLGIVWGAVMIDRSIVTEERQRSDGASSKLLIVLRAAIVLSAVSFATTLFGMLNFVAGSSGSGDAGQKTVGWFISLGTTFGIQFIMLVIALVLGERLIHMRPRFDDKLHRKFSEFEDEVAAPRNTKWLRATTIPIAALLLVGAAISFGFISISELWNFATSFGDDTGPQIGLGILLLIAALVMLRSARVMTSLWQPISLIFLLFVYFGTLAVSSLFSFDSYYGILQTESDLEQRKGSIVREETAQMIINARTSLDNQMASIREGDRSEEVDALVRDGIDTLVRNARNFDDELRRDALLEEQRIQERNDRIDAQIAQLREDKANARLDALDSLSEAGSLREQIVNLARQRDAAEARVQEAIVARDALQTNINNLRSWADCEENGLTDGICEQAPNAMSGIPSCGPRCEGYRTTADNLENVDLPAAQRAIETARQDLNAVESELQTAQVRLQAAQAETTFAEGEISPAAQRAQEIAARYDEQIRALEDQKSIGIVVAQSAEFDVGGLSASFAAFKSNPNPETLERYDEVCRTTRDGLLRVGVQDSAVREFDCQPAAMSILAASAGRVERAQTRFDAQCTVLDDVAPAPIIDPDAGAPQAMPVSQSAANDDASLRRVVDKTRSCLSIANVGQQAIVDASQDLTELESTYLSDSPRIRRAIEDLRRGNVFAIGAASAAVFIDVLILVVGLLVAMSRDSVLYDNPLDPGVEAVEAMLARTARWYAPDHKEATGMRIFYQYLEPRYVEGDNDIGGSTSDEIYRAAINVQGVPPQHQPLVNALLHALPARYKRTMRFHPLESGGKGEPVHGTAINGTIVSFISRKAHASGPDDIVGAVDYANPQGASRSRGLGALRLAHESRSPGSRRPSPGKSFDEDFDKGSGV